MLKIFKTQLTGHFNQIEEQEFEFEDGARAISQSITGDGNVYFHGLDEMEAITIEATKGAQPFPQAEPLMKDGKLAELTNLDSVVIISRFSDDERAFGLAKEVTEAGAWVVGISAVRNKDNQPFAETCDFHIDARLTTPLVPMENGERTGFPTVMTALYCYYGLFLHTMEILEEHGMEDML